MVTGAHHAEVLHYACKQSVARLELYSLSLLFSAVTAKSSHDVFYDTTVCAVRSRHDVNYGASRWPNSDAENGLSPERVG